MALMVQSLQEQDEEASIASSHSSVDEEVEESDTEEEEAKSGEEQDKRNDPDDKQDKGDGPSSSKTVKKPKWSDYIDDAFINETAMMSDEELNEFLQKHLQNTKVAIAKLNHAKALQKERNKEYRRANAETLKKEKAEKKKETAKIARETIFQVSVILPDGSSKMIEVSGEMTTASLRDKCAELMSMKKKDYKLVRLIVRGQDIGENYRTTIGGNKITKDSRIEVVLGVKGGGKRTKTSTGDAPKSKASLMKNLKQEIGGKLVRVPDNNVAPVITQTKAKVIQIVEAIDKKDNQVVAKMVKDLPKEILKKLATDVIPSSTRVPDRCKGVCDIIFEADVERLDDAEYHKKTIQDALYQSIHYSIIAQFADQSGTISWTAFLTTISDILSSATPDETMG